MNAYASELKASHERWKDQIGRAKPGREASQTASEAQEIAIQELRDRLPSASPRDEAEPLSLDVAMSFLLRHTPPASRRPAARPCCRSSHAW